MAVITAMLWERQLQNWWFRVFRLHFTDRCVRKPDTCHHSKEGVLTISELSKSHSGIKKNHGPYKISEWKNTLKQQNLDTFVSWWHVLEHIFIKVWQVYQWVLPEFSRSIGHTEKFPILTLFRINKNDNKNIATLQAAFNMQPKILC